MKRIVQSVFFIFLMWIPTACNRSSTVDQSILQIKKAIEKVEKNKDNMKEADWKAFEAEIEEPVKALYQAAESGQIGIEKRVQITALMGQLLSVVGDAGLENYTDEYNSIDSIEENMNDISVANDSLPSAIFE